MSVRAWPRWWSSAAGGQERRDEHHSQDQRSTDEQAHASAVGFGRMVRAVQQQYPDEDLCEGSAYVCGVDSVTVPQLVALADLEDAREQAQTHPDEPARDDAVRQATKAYQRAARETSTRGRAAF